MPAKPEGLRRNRTKTSTRTTLVPQDPKVAVVPDLPPDRSWRRRTKEHWSAVWLSPMAPEFSTAADYRGLVMLAELWDDFYAVEDSLELDLEKKVRLRTSLMSLIIRGEKRFGLTPMDRRSLQWSIDMGEEAEARTLERRNKAAVAAAQEVEDDGDAVDPRALLSG